MSLKTLDPLTELYLGKKNARSLSLKKHNGGKTHLKV